MAKTVEDLKNYIEKLNLPFYEASKETLIIQGPEDEKIAITVAGPVVVFRVKLMEIPAQDQSNFFQTLLELNASEMMHGTYGIEGQAVIISDSLQLQNLDYHEFAASVDDIMLAVASHHQRLSKYRSQKNAKTR